MSKLKPWCPMLLLVVAVVVLYWLASHQGTLAMQACREVGGYPHPNGQCLEVYDG